MHALFVSVQSQMAQISCVSTLALRVADSPLLSELKVTPYIAAPCPGDKIQLSCTDLASFGLLVVAGLLLFLL